MCWYWEFPSGLLGKGAMPFLSRWGLCALLSTALQIPGDNSFLECQPCCGYFFWKVWRRAESRLHINLRTSKNVSICVQSLALSEALGLRALFLELNFAHYWGLTESIFSRAMSRDSWHRAFGKSSQAVYLPVLFSLVVCQADLVEDRKKKH